MIYNNKLKTLIENEYHKCTGCRACMNNCPMLQHYTDNPLELLESLHEETYFDNTIDTFRMPFTCTNCGYCDHVCTYDVSLESVFKTLKQEMVAKYGFPKSFGKTPLEFHQNASFSHVFSTTVENERSNKNKKSKKRIFLPGCSPSSHSPDTIKNVYAYLQEHSDIDIFLKCCGNPTLSVGQNERYNTFNTSLSNDFEEMGVEEIVVLCMNCYRTLSEAYPHIKVLTLWEEMCEYGLPKYHFTDLPKFALHDPCPTRHFDQIHSAVREILSQMNIDYEEFKFSKNKTVCCGSGAMLSLVYPALADHHKLKRALQTKQEHILTYCQECTESLEQADKKTIHLLDLLFSGTQYDNWNQITQPTINKWLNRYKLKQIIDKDLK